MRVCVSCECVWAASVCARRKHEWVTPQGAIKRKKVLKKKALSYFFVLIIQREKEFKWEHYMSKKIRLLRHQQSRSNELGVKNYFRYSSGSIKDLTFLYWRIEFVSGFGWRLAPLEPSWIHPLLDTIRLGTRSISLPGDCHWTFSLVQDCPSPSQSCWFRTTRDQPRTTRGKFNS